MESLTAVIIPFDDRVILVSLLNRTEFSSRLSEVAQSLDAISGIQFLVSGNWVRTAMASWHGPNPESHRDVTAEAALLYAVWVADYL